MAVSTSSYFSNGFPGEIQLLKGTIFRKDTTPAFVVGQRYRRADGNVYVYSHFGADTNRGLLVAQDLSESAVVDTDNAVIAPASAVAVVGETAKPGTINSRFVQVTLASISANQFAGASWHTLDDTGEGFAYRIKGNTATGDPASGDIRIELYGRLQVAVDGTTDFGIAPARYSNLEAATAATDPTVVGVSVSTMDISAAAYGFVQVSGYSTVLDDGGVAALGSTLTLSDGVAGAVQLKDAETEPIVGFGVIAGDDTGHSVIDLKLDG